MAKEKHAWGDYYYRNKKDWRLEVLHSINQSIPSFSEIFDEDSFYIFVILIVISSILLAVFLSRVVGVTIREHHLVMERDWGEPVPANVFHFPWTKSAKKDE